MLTFTVPELQLRPVDLETRVTRSDDELAGQPGQLLIGGPFWTPITEPPAEDPETRAFLADPAYRWVLGVLALSIHVADNHARFERAWVDVDLAPVLDEGAEVVAWSMKPDRVTRSVKKTTSVNLGPKLTILDVGIEGAVERGVERSLDEVSLEAMNEMTASPRWILHRTPSAELRGCTRLALVVRAPRTATVEARLDVGCLTAKRQLLFFWPRTEHTQRQRISLLP